MIKIDRDIVKSHMEALHEKAHAHATLMRDKWVSTYCNFAYEDGERFINDTTKYEQSLHVYDNAVTEYLDRYTTRIPNDMIEGTADARKRLKKSTDNASLLISK